MQCIPVTHHIVPSTGWMQDAMDFDVADWTALWDLPGHSAFTAANVVLHYQWPCAPVVWALGRAVFGTGDLTSPRASVRFRSLYYNQSNQQIWSRIGPELTQRPNFTVDGLTAIITDEVNAMIAQAVMYQINVQVKGKGRLYGATVELVYNIDG